MRRIRVLIAKPGLDGHDRGAKVMACGFRDAGFEVIYTGIRQSPEQIVRTAIQEDVNIIALSILSGAHMVLCKRIIKLLNDSEINLIVGGIIPEKDISELKRIGITEVLGSGTSIKKSVEFVKNLIKNESN